MGSVRWLAKIARPNLEYNRSFIRRHTHYTEKLVYLDKLIVTSRYEMTGLGETNRIDR